LPAEITATHQVHLVARIDPLCDYAVEVGYLSGSPVCWEMSKRSHRTVDTFGSLVEPIVCS
jgi:hypothetical protein